MLTPLTEDRNSSEVSVQVAITDSSLSINVRSRAITAFDRLLGGFVGIPAAWLERVEDRIRNRTVRESTIQKAAANRMKTAILNDEEISTVVADMALCSRLVPITNKVRVAELAVDELLASADTESQAGRDDGGDVDDDWLNHFAAYAERASSERVRQLWARVLAGEIRLTGSFSLSSLRLLSELDQQMALTFKEEVEHRIGNAAILRPKQEEMKGDRLTSLAFLEEVGLLQTIDHIGGVVRQISPNRDGRGFLVERNLMLSMEIRDTVKLPIISLTRAGRELVSILPSADPLEVLERVGSAIEDKVISMEIHRIVGKTGQDLLTSHLKTLKTKG